MISLLLPRLETWVLCRFFDASMPRFDASIPRFDTCFDPSCDHRNEVGVWSRRHSMLVASMVASMHVASMVASIWVTSMIASIASLVLSFVVEELGRLDASIYSLRRYSLRRSLGCSMLRCFSASLECFWARLETRSNASRLPSLLRCRSFRSLESGAASSALPRLETWVLCRFFDASLRCFDTSFRHLLRYFGHFDNRFDC